MSSSSGTDHEMSDSSSPISYTRDSPYSSPSQQVPQLTMDLTTLTCADNNLYNFKNSSNTPYLRIMEQPQNHFRFRYVSEMVGTHGCLLAKSNDTKSKKHPTVELVNYTGQALIRCRLAQHNKSDEHPHKLLEDEQDREVSYQVPEKGIYKVGFPGMGIIHTAKKDVANLLFKKYSELLNNKSVNAKELRSRCESQAKEINLNIVRLKFTAHDLVTGKEICPPVYSDPIHNMKSAATNEMKICRMSLSSGRPSGGDDVFILVEKVNKKNIMIRFYELNEDGETVWTSKGNFLQSDVHHQYAIVFRTPPYKDPQTPVDVTVFMELVRPSDGQKSDPKEFTYKADPVYKTQSKNKKRRMESPYSSLNSSSSGSITNEVPLTVFFSSNEVKEESEEPAIKLPLQTASSSQCGLGNALNGDTLEPSPMWSIAPVPPVVTTFPELKLTSEEMTRIARPADNTHNININDDLLALYVESFNSSLNDLPSEMTGMEYINCSINANNYLIPDSGRVKTEPTTSSSKEKVSQAVKEDNSEYQAYYTPEEADEVKQLVKELCEIIRTKSASKNQEAREKLERLFEIRLSNGDTFLHMTLCSNQSSFETVVKVIHSMRMSHLLNYTNEKQQTILHLAVVHATSDIVSLLIAKGCDPNVKDTNGDTAIHYAVRYNRPLLDPLLNTIKKHNPTCNLDATNLDKQSPLHLCVVYGASESAESLLRAGADISVRDALGRSPLHLAAYDGRTDVLRRLLLGTNASDIDAIDEQGNTALQIVCDRPMDDNTIEIVKLLLDKKADPLKHEDHNKSAFKLSGDKPSVREVILQYVSAENVLEDEVKSEPDDEYESAEEEIEVTGLSELSSYIKAVSAQIDAAHAWPELAARLNASSLMSWFQNQPSPASSLLQYVKECRDDISSKSLALMLEDMGLTAAANIIRSHIE